MEGATLVVNIWPQPATQTTVNILGTLPLPTRLDRSQELNSVFGFETALNARVLGIREDVKLSWTKKSLKYSYLLTQEHETWTIRAANYCCNVGLESH